MLVLTTPSIEGKTITAYYGLVTGEAILGACIQNHETREILQSWVSNVK